MRAVCSRCGDYRALGMKREEEICLKLVSSRYKGIYIVLITEKTLHLEAELEKKKCVVNYKSLIICD